MLDKKELESLQKELDNLEVVARDLNHCGLIRYGEVRALIDKYYDCSY